MRSQESDSVESSSKPPAASGGTLNHYEVRVQYFAERTEIVAAQDEEDAVNWVRENVLRSDDCTHIISSTAVEQDDRP